MTLWSLDAVSMSGRRVPRLDDVTLGIPRGVTAVLGQSGAGKTSLLNVLVGFESPSSGRVEFRGTTDHGRLGVFWSPPSQGLWPHLTVREHLTTVASGELQAGVGNIAQLLKRFDLEPLADVKPGSLSLGERSRLSVARALASGASVLVMDEPLAHVDSKRVGLYWAAIREQCASAGASLVFATHSPDVVLREASHVVCLTGGRLSYAGSVEELYERPSSSELASLLGPCNWMTSEDEQRWLATVPGSLGDAILTGRLPTGPTVATCVRPERLGVEASPGGSLKVESARFAGASAEVDLVDERDGVRRTFVHRPVDRTLKTGDRVLLKMLMLLVAALFLPGCDLGAEPMLHVKHEDYWSMPPDGQRVPAPRGMTVSPQGEYLVLDNAGRVLVFDEKGDLQRQWWMPEYSVGKPEGVCVLKDGRIVVADTHYHRVVFFDHEGHVTGMFGQLGTEPGEFIYPVAVAQDADENLYVCEYGNYNDRVQKFRLDGTFVAQVGGYGTGDGQFQRPSGMVWFEDRLYVVDAFNNRVQVFGKDGSLVAILGASDRISELHYPYDIAVTEKGELFIVEYAAGRVSKFDRTGKLLGRYGTTGTQAGQFSTPWGLAIDKRGRLYVCDTGNRRIVELEL